MPLTNRGVSVQHNSPSPLDKTWKQESIKSVKRGGFSRHLRRLPHVVLGAIVVLVLLARGNMAPRQLNSAATVASGMVRQVQLSPVTSERLDRIYCMVPFIWNAEVYDEIMDTWGKRCDVIRFMIDPILGDEKGGYIDLREILDHYLHEKPNIVVINMTRAWNSCGESPCRNIWEKMWRSWVWVDENEKDMAEWFAKVDYDTFFFPENLANFVRDQRAWKPTEDHYFGHKLYNNRIPFAVGAANMLSKSTLEKLAEVYRTMPSNGNGGERGKCEDRAHASEEISTSICLKTQLNIEVEDTLDSENREHITISEIEDVLRWNRTEQGEWWFWEGKPSVAKDKEECCAHRPIGFHHYKKRGQLKKLENQFYGPIDNSNNDYKNLDEITKRYVDKVRKAMGVPRSQVQAKVA